MKVVTFTQFEVRDILNEVLLDYLDSKEVDSYRLDILQKLKVVNNEK